jgi:hypothetical protein
MVDHSEGRSAGLTLDRSSIHREHVHLTITWIGRTDSYETVTHKKESGTGAGRDR